MGLRHIYKTALTTEKHVGTNISHLLLTLVSLHSAFLLNDHNDPIDHGNHSNSGFQNTGCKNFK